MCTQYFVQHAQDYNIISWHPTITSFLGAVFLLVVPGPAYLRAGEQLGTAVSQAAGPPPTVVVSSRPRAALCIPVLTSPEDKRFRIFNGGQSLEILDRIRVELYIQNLSNKYGTNVFPHLDRLDSADSEPPSLMLPFLPPFLCFSWFLRDLTSASSLLISSSFFFRVSSWLPR